MHRSSRFGVQLVDSAKHEMCINSVKANQCPDPSLVEFKQNVIFLFEKKEVTRHVKDMSKEKMLLFETKALDETYLLRTLFTMGFSSP